jgi:hypothetical protein
VFPLHLQLPLVSPFTFKLFASSFQHFPLKRRADRDLAPQEDPRAPQERLKKTQEGLQIAPVTSLGNLRCSWESPGNLGCSLGAPWVLLGCSWGAPGASLGSSLGLLGRLWKLLSAPGRSLGAPCELLGAPWVLLGCSWGLLGSSWVLPGFSWVLRFFDTPRPGKNTTCEDFAREPLGPPKEYPKRIQEDPSLLQGNPRGLVLTQKLQAELVSEKSGAFR